MVDLARTRVPYDPREIAAAYEAHQRELYGFALGATRSAEAAEDVVEEAYLRLIRERSEGRAPSNTRAWLYRALAPTSSSRGRDGAASPSGSCRSSSAPRRSRDPSASISAGTTCDASPRRSPC